MIYKDRYAHGMGVISENTAYRSVSVSVDKFSFVLVGKQVDILLSKNQALRVLNYC